MRIEVDLIGNAGTPFSRYMQNGKQNHRDRWEDHLYFDFKKVFDCIPHLRILHKLNELDICGRLHIWIQSELTKKTLRVKVGEE